MTVNTYREALFHVKRGFMIIGLTGYTGSGCTSASEILQKEQKPALPGFDSIASRDYGLTERKIYEKLSRTWDQLDWDPFVRIDVGRLIFCFAVIRALSYESESVTLAALRESIEEEKAAISPIQLLTANRNLTEGEQQALVAAYQCSDKFYGRLYKSLAERDSHFSKANWILLLQDFGDQIRKYGHVEPSESDRPHPQNLFILPEAIRQIIKCYRKTNRRSHFVIDAFRNPYEVEYFQRRYGESYLVGILRDQAVRKKQTQDKGLDLEFVNRLEERESGHMLKYGKDKAEDCLTSLNIDACLQKSDFFIHNIESTTRSRPRLEFGLIKLITLAKWPGCIPPTIDERSMQIAMTARQMSGCISRKVGATILDKNGYVKGVGWNDPPEGQMPCSLRTGADLTNNPTTSVFSEYERGEEFTDKIHELNIGNNAFCFKSIYQGIKNKDKPEFTRSLHGEENAVFQALANSNGKLPGSTLYTTDRTCTLCAKKAYQVGVKRIVYVEDYTDDAIKQTINSGSEEIRVERFEGVTGAAYFKLFASLIPEKDLNAIDP